MFNMLFKIPPKRERIPSLFFNNGFFIANGKNITKEDYLKRDDFYVHFLTSKRTFIVCLLALVMHFSLHQLFQFFGSDTVIGSLADKDTFVSFTKYVGLFLIFVLLPLQLFQYRQYANPLDTDVWTWGIPEGSDNFRFIIMSFLGIIICTTAIYCSSYLFLFIKRHFFSSYGNSYFLFSALLYPFFMTMCGRLAFQTVLINWRCIGRAYRRLFVNIRK